MMVDGRSMDLPPGAGLASFLADEGWEVFVPDLRGRGLSGPTVAEGGTWTYDDLVRFDLPALVASARAAVPNRPCWVVGNSLAGHVSAAAEGIGAYEEPPDGHVFFSVNMWVRALEPSFFLRLRKAAGSAMFGLFALLFGRIPARRLRIGPVDEAGPYCLDVCRFWNRGWGSREGVDYLAALAHVRGPALSIVGRADTYLAAPVGARAWFERLGGVREFRLVGVGDEGLEFAPGHMTLVTDPRSRPAWRMAARFMAEHSLDVGPAPM
jgi:pimeloyl-ACP methyl ester carboxylesterase